MSNTTHLEPDAATTYYESARGQTISRLRALEELEKHGYDNTPLGRKKQAEMEAQFFAELGDHEHYDATKVLDFLGY